MKRIIRRNKRKIYTSESETISEVEKELNELVSETPDVEEEEEYDTELERQEAEFMKKHNIRRRDLFEGDEE